MPPNASVQELDRHREAMATTVKRRQLVALRAWTAEWEKELIERQMLASRRALPSAQVVKPREPRAITQLLPQHLGTNAYGYVAPDLTLQHMTDMTLQDNSINLMFPELAQGSSLNTQVQQNRLATRIEPLPCRSLASSAPQSLIYRSNDNPYHPANAAALSYSRNPYLSLNPGPAVGNVPAQNINPVSTIPGPSYSGRPKRRGQPRTRMFITKPNSDVPLSVRAQTDDEEILRNFPEHLSLPEVMKRFVKSDPRFGGWPTERMLDFLMIHPNAKDFPDIAPKQRRANVKRWVTKEKDSCNNKQRKEAGIKPRNGAEGNTSDSAPQTPVTPAYPPFTTPLNHQVELFNETAYNFDLPIFQTPVDLTSIDSINDPKTQAHWPSNPPIRSAIPVSDVVDSDTLLHPPILGTPDDMTSNTLNPTTPAHWPSNLPIQNAIPVSDILDPDTYLQQDSGQNPLPTNGEEEILDVPSVAGQDFEEELRNLESLNF